MGPTGPSGDRGPTGPSGDRGPTGTSQLFFSGENTTFTVAPANFVWFGLGTSTTLGNPSAVAYTICDSMTVNTIHAAVKAPTSTGSIRFELNYARLFGNVYGDFIPTSLVVTVDVPVPNRNYGASFTTADLQLQAGDLVVILAAGPYEGGFYPTASIC